MKMTCDFVKMRENKVTSWRFKNEDSNLVSLSLYQVRRFLLYKRVIIGVNFNHNIEL